MQRHDDSPTNGVRIRVIPTGAALGADVEGVDLSRPLDASTIEAVGLGSTVPVSEETTEVGAQVNRRIEIVVRT